MGRRLRLGIIGLGFGARVQLPVFLSIPGLQVVGIADSGSGRAKRVAASAGEGVRVWNGWKEAVEASDVDAISVVTPPWAQADIVCAALAAGKHVLCEKPFGASGQEAARMWEIARNRDGVNAVDFEFRMEPGIAELQRRVKSGDVGEVGRIGVRWLTGGGLDPSVRWSWRHDAHLGGGVLNAFGSHVIDYIEWICGSWISRISARSEILIGERRDAEGRERRVTAEDSCELMCDLASGALAHVVVSNCSSAEAAHQIEIYGEVGRLVYIHEAPFTPDRAKLWIQTDTTGVRPVTLETLPGPAGPDTRIRPFREIAARFVEAAWGSEVPDLPDFACGLRVQRVLDAARESFRHGGVMAVVEKMGDTGG